MKTETIEYTVPTWSITAIEYGELDGLTTEEFTLLNEFMDELPKRILGIDYSDEPWFSITNDIQRNMGGDVVTATITYQVK
jgi:hypothetical protein